MKLLQIMRKCGAISGKSKIRSDSESGAWSGRGILCGQVQLPGPVRGEDYAIAEFATWRNAAEATIEGGIRRRVRLNQIVIVILNVMDTIFASRFSMNPSGGSFGISPNAQMDQQADHQSDRVISLSNLMG